MVDASKISIFEFENNSSELEIQVEVHKDVYDFKLLSSVSWAFAEIDRLQRVDEYGWTIKNRYDQRKSAKLRSFHVNSDPVVDLLALVPWIGSLILVLSCVKEYKKLKEGAAELTSDIRKLVLGIEGLAEEYIDPMCLYVYVKLIVLLDEHEKRRSASLFTRYRAIALKLIDSSGKLPTIKVNSKDN